MPEFEEAKLHRIQVNTSPTHFASSFKRATGILLHQYVIKQRVERAKLLLETTDLPISSIASQVGFSSHSHLTWHCKSFTGITPKQLSKKHKILINFRNRSLVTCIFRYGKRKIRVLLDASSKPNSKK
jgi:AraC-like DNA-binding protein